MSSKYGIMITLNEPPAMALQLVVPADDESTGDRPNQPTNYQTVDAMNAVAEIDRHSPTRAEVNWP